jgi:DNA-binding CsgD family transcriptional regulator
MISERPELSHLERRILVLIVRGRTNRQIKQVLGINDYVLVGALRSLYRKSGIHYRSQPYIPGELRSRLVEWGQHHLQRENL